MPTRAIRHHHLAARHGCQSSRSTFRPFGISTPVKHRRYELLYVDARSVYLLQRCRASSVYLAPTRSCVIELANRVCSLRSDNSKINVKWIRKQALDWKAITEIENVNSAEKLWISKKMFLYGTLSYLQFTKIMPVPVNA